MARSCSKCGLTLVELMVTSAISIIILAAVASSFIGGIRLMKAAFATAEMSLRVRDLRDRLLFHAAPTYNGTVWAGLLSGTNSTDVLEGNCRKIYMRCPALKTTGNTTVNQTIQIVFKNYGTGTCSFWSEDRYDERWPARWLNPCNMNLLADSEDTDPLTWALKSDGSEDKTRFYIHLTGREEIAGLPVEHGERIVVSLFGKQQQTYPNGKGGLDQ